MTPGRASHSLPTGGNHNTHKEISMSIDRVPEVPFAQIANSALRDRRLSYKARGVLAMVLSHSGEWTASREWLVTQSDYDGQVSVQGALDELTRHGYRRTVREQRPDGTWRSWTEWTHMPECI